MVQKKKAQLFLSSRERERRILAVMENRGITRYAMAKALRKSMTSFNASITARNPHINTVKDIAYVLGTSISFLCDRAFVGPPPKGWRDRRKDPK